MEVEALKKQLLFIHGGGHGAYEAGRHMAMTLQSLLGPAYEICCPRMPDEDSPDYAAWRGLIEERLTAGNGNAIAVGHSLGASVLLKLLSESHTSPPIAGLFLLAPPYWGAVDWEVGDYALREGFASKLPSALPIFIYHSRDDEIVPFDHLARYADKLPGAVCRELDGGGHLFHNVLGAVARDIAAP
ncbi:alpha/beta fold hydrolase [Paenibacillus arenilitoris]|uniref:Alpha/beta fold hydrolase n=1 Tax=Paenibacillus arenilitoris TaxID=2772299 RepID=A0A927H6P4_9BACL|nr:alpha/beta fold hydrolase [Paenibacillus arenilitoris]MBD2868774.1 alpha/beta fold hydrolase [Paenibacillus arenilitoris]